MNEILNNYKLFSVIFLTLVLIVFVIYKFLFEIENEEDISDGLELNCETESINLTSLEHDEKVFQKFNKLLPPAAGSIYFLRNNNMTMVFHKRGLDGLYKFYEECKNSEYAFRDEELEELKTDFYLAVEQYILTFELNSRETSSGYYKVNYNVDGLHFLVDDLLTKYDKLSNTSLKKLLLL